MIQFSSENQVKKLNFTNQTNVNILELYCHTNSVSIVEFVFEKNPLKNCILLADDILKGSSIG